MSHPNPPITGDVHVGEISAGGIVPSGHRVRLLGTVSGDLVVEDGAKAEVFGEIWGEIYAEGRVNIYDGATVRGRLHGTGWRDRRSPRPAPSALRRL